MDLEKSYRCCNCGEKFISIDDARKHINIWFERGNRHNIEDNSTCENCTVCKRRFG